MCRRDRIAFIAFIGSKVFEESLWHGCRRVYKFTVAAITVEKRPSSVLAKAPPTPPPCSHIVRFAAPVFSDEVHSDIMTLQNHLGSAVVNDVDGTLYQRTLHRRSEMGPVHVIAPGGVETARHNPFNLIRINTNHEESDTLSVADWCLMPANAGKEQEWRQSVQHLWAGLILYTLLYRDHKERNPAGVRRLLMGEGQELRNALHHMWESEKPFLAHVSREMREKTPNELKFIIGKARQYTEIWTCKKAALVTSDSDFCFGSLKKEPMTVYLLVAPGYENTYKPLIRSVLESARSALHRCETVAREPVLFMMNGCRSYYESLEMW